MQTFFLLIIAVAATVSLCSGERTSNKRMKKEIPLEFLRSSGLIGAMSNSSAYLNLFLNKYKIQKSSTDAYGGKGNNAGRKDDKFEKAIERAGLEMEMELNYAGCQPYDQLVTLPNARPNILMFPNCILLKQCGGCCGHSELACKPTEVKNKTIKVVEYKYAGEKLQPLDEIKHVVVEEHTACECLCKLNENDCNLDVHVFDGYHCSCSCKEKNQACPSNKIWNGETCSCECAYLGNCGGGYQYNTDTCRCEETLERKADDHHSVTTLKPEPSMGTSKAACSHAKPCQKYYKVVSRSGTCKCVFDRNSYLMAQSAVKYKSSRVG